MSARRHPRKLLAASLIATLAAAMCVVLSPVAASAAAPELVRTLGGPNHAEMMPSGMEIAPDGSIVIADTGNNQVAKYTTGGTQVWRVGYLWDRQRSVLEPA